DDGVAAQVGLFEPRRQHIAWHELIILECVQHCLLTIVAQRVNLLVVLACPWLSGLLYGSHDRQHIMSVVLMYRQRAVKQQYVALLVRHEPDRRATHRHLIETSALIAAAHETACAQLRKRAGPALLLLLHVPDLERLAQRQLIAIAPDLIIGRRVENRRLHVVEKSRTHLFQPLLIPRPELLQPLRPIHPDHAHIAGAYALALGMNTLGRRFEVGQRHHAYAIDFNLLQAYAEGIFRHAATAK